MVQSPLRISNFNSSKRSTPTMMDYGPWRRSLQPWRKALRREESNSQRAGKKKPERSSISSTLTKAAKSHKKSSKVPSRSTVCNKSLASSGGDHWCFFKHSDLFKIMAKEGLDSPQASILLLKLNLKHNIYFKQYSTLFHLAFLLAFSHFYNDCL